MTPLQTKTAFSLLQSPMMPATLVQAVKDKGYHAVALTDDDVLYGMDNFYHEAIQADIKPILGLTATLGGIYLNNQPFPILLLVQNQTGYHNLLKISSYLKTTKDQLVPFEKIGSNLEGLFIIFPEISEPQLLLTTNNADQLKAFSTKIQTYVTNDHIFLGVTLEMTAPQLEQTQRLAESMASRLVAVDPIFYAEPQDYFAQQVLQKIDLGETIVNVNAVHQVQPTRFVQSATQLTEKYTEIGLLAAVETTDWIAENSHFELKKTTVTLPDFQTPNGQSASVYLRLLAENGLKARLQGKNVPDKRYQERLDTELAVIERLGFSDYFLIVWDVLNFAHRQDIRTGPGRGSVAGSLVAYVLWITDVDPLQYDLLFERFLNPERAQMPDIDIDIPDNRREDVLNYLHDKYGHDRVAQIITFSTLAMRAAIRDVARVFGLNPGQVDQLAKSLPSGDASMTLERAYQESQKFKNALRDLPIDGELLYQVARKIEGLPRNSSLHAAGIVLSSDPLVETIPVMLGEEGRLVTQLTKNPVEAFGLLKIDFLALSNLTILDIALSEVKREDRRQDFNIATINLNDSDTLELFSKGKTNGIFQFESAGMKNMLRQLQPDSFEDIIAANALFRPGPSQNIGHFIARKHGQEERDVPDSSMANILKPTYGIIVYQEQVMRVAEQFAGFSLGDADLLRRAMSKKDATKIAAIKTEFVAGASTNGHSKELANQIFSYIETFAQYGFNRSHAVAYSKLAMQLAYLKVHYPLAFYKAVLNDALADKKKIQVYIGELKETGIQLMGPDINNSWQGYTSRLGGLQMGLASISGIRRDFRSAILQERQENGPYRDLADLIGRLDTKYRKLSLFEPLIYAGALDQFGLNRQTLLDSVPRFIEAIGLSGQSMTLFKSLLPKVTHADDLPLSEKLGQEYRYLGIYLSGHPLETVLNQLNAETYQTIATLLAGQVDVHLVVYVEAVKVIRTKKGDQMVFLDVMDLTGRLSITVFPNLYRQTKDLLKAEQILSVTGKVELQRGRDGIQMIANRIQDSTVLFDDIATQLQATPQIGQWFIRIPKDKEEQILVQLQVMFKAHHGSNPVLLVYEKDNRKLSLGKNYWLDDSDVLKEQLTQLVGQGNSIFTTI